MIGKVFLLALLVAVATASPFNQDDSLVGYGDAVSMLFKAWKKIMPCGFPAENIPVMAPFSVDFQNFTYVDGPTNIAGNVSNFRVFGLNNFEVISSSYDETTMTRKFDIIYPEIQIFGNIAMDGTFSLGGLPLPVHHEIMLNKKISGWRYVVEYTFGQSLSNSNGLRISSFDIKYYIAEVQADNWNKNLDIAANNFSNDFFADFFKLFSEEIQPYVNPLFAKYVLPNINNVLSTMDITQLTNFFAVQAEMWNNAGCSV